ncbi:MAG: tRNA (adenosine(37)-N6)-threonylcarbamoyltransferase complex ATPase subunit type 1 TsaE [Candidatus Buchananbacteria bacterium]|nr:tRNA (adenosine(37)-N6)-threonylcarbamoyltransferase complex ATPase subunit type 1 TsaE [Candidatus Buchananbacteria bacterium]
MIHQLTTEKDTFKLAKQIASGLRGGETLALIGDLGAGKTTFTKGLAKALGLDPDAITSPTFVLMKVYQLSKPKHGIQTLVHIDAYRLAQGGELIDIGLLDYMGQHGVVTVIEWADRVEDVLLDNTTRFEFALKDKGSRVVKIK